MANGRGRGPQAGDGPRQLFGIIWHNGCAEPPAVRQRDHAEPVALHGEDTRRRYAHQLVTTVAFLGLGLMGTPMAARLADAGHRVVVWNRAKGRTAPLVRRGATAAPTPAAAAANSELAITMLADAAAVRDILTGADGVLQAPPAVLIQMSTVSPAELSELAEIVRSASAGHTQVLDAPVLGSVPQARAGRLRILVGGPAGTFQRCRDVLAVCGEPCHVGPAGVASALKLVLNTAVAPMVGLLAESLALSEVLGLDGGLVLDELARSRVGPLVQRKRSAIESGLFPADSRLRLFAKDMRLAVESGRACGLEMQMTAAALALAEMAMDEGLGDLDYAVIVARLRAAAAGRRFGQPPS